MGTGTMSVETRLSKVFAICVVLACLPLAGPPGFAAPLESTTPVILELDLPPAVQAYTECLAAKAGKAQAATAARQRLAEIEAAQQRLLWTLSSKADRFQVLFRVQRVYNGIAVRANENELEALAELPGIRGIHRLSPCYLCNSTSVSFIGTPALWDGLGLTGRNVSIGIIDTGIDYLHPDFGGRGDNESNDPAVLGDVTFPTVKVKGGYDFVGDNYDPRDPVLCVPSPDPDPMDLQGHGTHVAGTAAGYGVTAAGETYRGPYDAEIDLRYMQVGPGAAPEADLYALKAYGMSEFSFVVMPAVEWAVDPNGDGDLTDHLDVINLSIGGNYYGALDSPLSEACDNAALAGVAVVAASGRRGDVYFITSAPGCAARAISVAASEDDDPAEPTLAADRLYTASSRGPAQSHGGLMLLKPDIAAPGSRIRSASAYAEQPHILYGVRSGSSHACPHIAGLMALLRQAYPAWEVEELKALVMNTATHDVFMGALQSPPRAAPARVGAGRVDAQQALQSMAIAFDAGHPERVSVTFDTTEVLGAASESRAIRVRNKGEQTAAYTASLDFLTEIPGVTIGLGSQETGDIAPGRFVDLPLTLEADAAAMQHSFDPASPRNFGAENVAHWLSDVSGFVVLTPVGEGIPIRVPFYAAPRPASNMTTAVEAVDVREKTELSFSLAGQDLQTGGQFPLDEVSLVGAFELLYYSPDEEATTGLEDAADIKFIGVRSDYADRTAAGEGMHETTIQFALATHGNWFSPNWIQVHVFVDRNQDGTADYDVFGRSESTFLINDVFVTRLTDFVSPEITAGRLNHYAASEFDTVAFCSNVLVLPVPAYLLGLTDANTTVDFWVKTYLLTELGFPEVEREIDATAPLRYNVAQPGLRFPKEDASPFFLDLDGASIAVVYDADAFANNGELLGGEFEYYTPAGSLGILLLHHHNQSGKKVQWLPLMTSGDSDGDTILDADEGAGDTDGDGVPNLFDTDSDGDGLLDLYEGVVDTDADGMPNFLDTDSDDDTFSDQAEVNEYGTNPYNNDSDSDGIPDNVDGLSDPDEDGLINALDPDSDGDSIPDMDEGTQDQDLDGTPNFLDLDSDGDTLEDADEGADDLEDDGIPNFLDLDSDGDSLDDEAEANTLQTDPYSADTDEDGRPDNVEIDAGSDPRVADPPEAVENVAASDGTFTDRVQVTWDPLPGSVEYRVYRGTTANPEEAEALGADWQSETTFDDMNALPPTEIPGGLCRGTTYENVVYQYWLRARVAPAGEPATDSGPFSAPDDGYRARAGKSARAALAAHTSSADMLILLSLVVGVVFSMRRSGSAGILAGPRGLGRA